MNTFKAGVTRYPYFNKLNLAGEWGDAHLSIIDTSISAFYALNPERGLLGWLEKIEFSLSETKYAGLTSREYIRLNPNGLTELTIVHELAHAWDASTNWELSKRIRKATGSGFLIRFLHGLCPSAKLFWYRVGSPPPPCGVDKNFNALEDFAESVTAFIFPEEAYQRAGERGYSYEKWGYVRFHDTPRGKFIRDLVS
jgi:hypothetical protein